MRVQPFSAGAGLLLALLLAACAPAAPRPVPAPQTAETPADPLQLDRSCAADADCVVKNVGNCCGYFPACVNRDAQPDPDAVRERCAAGGMASVCGFQEISACSCVANRCEAVRQPLRAPLE
ncbi:hypothetical protein QFW77_04065 [Luteimonas sp. RD2P54]|uniref:Secreted protein n=1 Tax=Luteimonas endophytica TaxID=3042023 RepID=A0ABT6J5S2_9GAMM|nr:hypothetical protein [Luteimonas endophytica]MDH5822165.1 hypothetical protein [Luteimonas endophytica]